MPSRPPPIPGRQRAAGSCGHRSPRRRSQPSRQRWPARPRRGASRPEGCRQLRRANEGRTRRPRPAGGAVEPEFVAAAADGDALGRSTPATPPVTHNLTHTLFSMPADATGRRRLPLDWTWEPTGLAVAARRRYQVPDERESRNTAGPRWTPAAPIGPNLRNPCGGELAVHKKNRRTDTGGAARRKIAGHELGAPFHDQNTRGRSEKQSGDPAQTRRVPPLPDYPPGLSGTIGSTSPAAAADTTAAHRHPSGQTRAATAQSTAALAPAPAALQSRSP